ncbi:MAG TPA: TetR/AcrR family transcriptional regulator [Woeseiaceae bacterium]|nr:TetR/AcrR family transcriptional regulator [Woeseiaceae bacterium]
MSRPRFRRRKDDRPEEITRAALAAFAEKGYAATRVTDVAKRAGVSKGLLYLYFRTKEELFKAVIKSVVSPRIEALQKTIDQTELSAEDYLRGPFLELARQLPKSPARVLVRLMIAEGHRHPDLTAWYWENVVAHGLGALRKLIQRGVDAGEFRPSAVQEFPQLLISPVLTSVAWSIVFDPHHELDSDRFIEAHVDLLIRAIRAPGNTQGRNGKAGSP